jgi:hypothetical protein
MEARGVCQRSPFKMPGGSSRCVYIRSGRCRAPRSWIRSPRMIVTDPFAKPTATCERSSTAAALDTEKKDGGPRCLSTVSVQNARRQFPVRLHPKSFICRMCVMEPVS